MPSPFTATFTDGQQITVDGKTFEYVLANNLFKNVTQGGGAVSFSISVAEASATVGSGITIERNPSDLLDFTSSGIVITVTIDGINASFAVIDSNTISAVVPTGVSLGAGKIVSVAVTPTGQTTITETATIELTDSVVFDYWWDASTLTGQTDGQALTGNIPSTGTDTTALTNTANPRPLYRASGFNGNPYLEFQGTQDLRSASSLTLDNPFVIVAIRNVSGANQETILRQGTDSTYGISCSVPRNTSNGAIGVGRVTPNDGSFKRFNSANWIGDTEFAILLYDLAPTNANVKIYKNNVEIATTNIVGFTANIDAATTGVITIGSANNTAFLSSEIYAIGTIPRSAGLAAAQNAVNELIQQYGV